MRIPETTFQGSLPPYINNSPCHIDNMSPYKTNIIDFVERYGTTKHRIDLLYSLLFFRENLQCLSSGRQWIGGSFLTTKELIRNKPPSDIDIITIFDDINKVQANNMRHLFNNYFLRRILHLDSYFIFPYWDTLLKHDCIRFWYGLFAHNKENTWIGMLDIELNTPEEDIDAFNIITERYNDV